MLPANCNIPIIFQKLQAYEVEDTRFLKVKIWLMHLGQNYNGSIFEKEQVEEAVPSLANTPILCFIEENSEGEDDFSDHRYVIVKEDGKFKYKYKGQAIGVIPETNNAKFEFRVCDDGIEREFLTCEGLVWTKWEEPVDILNRDILKSQSMELDKDFEGYEDDDGIFHFTKFKFFGATGLGIDYSPGMHSATIELQNFTLENFTQELQSKMEQFKNYMASKSLELEKTNFNIDKTDKGGKNVDEKLELLKKYNIEQSALNFSIEELSLEDLEMKLKEFTLSNNQLEDEIRKVLRTKTVIAHDYWGDAYESQLFYFIDIKDGFVIVIDNNWDNYFGVPYTVNGDTVNLDLDNKVAYMTDWRPRQDGEVTTVFAKAEFDERLKVYAEKAVEKAKETFNAKETEDYKTLETEFTTLKQNYATLEEKANTLQEFQNTTLSKERTNAENEIFESFSEKLSADEIEEVKKVSKDMTLDTIEEKLFAMVGKKNANFTKKKEKNMVKVSVNPNVDDKPLDPYKDLFEKYL